METSALTYHYGRNDPFDAQTTLENSHIRSMAFHPHAGIEPRPVSNNGVNFYSDSVRPYSTQSEFGGATNRTCLPPISSLLDFARAKGERNDWEPVFQRSLHQVIGHDYYVDVRQYGAIGQPDQSFEIDFQNHNQPSARIRSRSPVDDIRHLSAQHPRLYRSMSSNNAKRTSLQSQASLSSHSGGSAGDSSPELNSTATPIHTNKIRVPSFPTTDRHTHPVGSTEFTSRAQQSGPQSPHSSTSTSSSNSSGVWQHHHYFSPAAVSSSPTFSVVQDRYVCTSCSKAFSRPSSLRIHSHSHTGEKPFKCPHRGCGKAFSVRSNMKRHERGCHADRTGDIVVVGAERELLPAAG